MSQPALTKQVKRLEALLGVSLFERSRSGVALTGAGRVLAHRVPSLLDDWDDVLRETKAAASRAARVLRVGFLASAANEATQRIVTAFSARRPGWRVEMRQATWSNPSAGLADGDVDVALLRLPFPGDDALRTQVLFTEPRWVALPTGHPLATEERDGHAPRIGAVTDQPDEWLGAIANGYGIALAPESAARFYARPGVVYVPVTGVSPTRAAVAWPPAADANPAVQDFVRCCLEDRDAQHLTGR